MCQQLHNCTHESFYVSTPIGSWRGWRLSSRYPCRTSLTRVHARTSHFGENKILEILQLPSSMWYALSPSATFTGLLFLLLCIFIYLLYYNHRGDWHHWPYPSGYDNMTAILALKVEWSTTEIIKNPHSRNIYVCLTGFKCGPLSTSPVQVRVDVELI